MSSKSSPVFRIPPYFYIHVLDQSTHVTRLEIGPKTYIRQDHESVVLGPEKMIIIPPQNYCIVENPIQRNAKGEVEFDENGQAKLWHADKEIRLAQQPFPLYPGETLKQKVTVLTTVPANTALRLRADYNFKDSQSVEHIAGNEWLFEGPGTYIPRKEVSVLETVHATILGINQAIRLQAVKECKDRQGTKRIAGEEWILKMTGAYLPGAYEKILGIVNAYVLTDKQALHIRAKRTFTDDFNKLRKSGEEWLITVAMTETHVPHVHEEVVGVISITTLTNRQYCVIMDPVDDTGKPQLGRKKLIRGGKSFFLMPGEHLERGIQDVYVLGDNEGLILRAVEEHQDQTTGETRRPGDRWMIRGPIEYVPDVGVEVVRKQVAIPLDENEGIYVRDIKTGKVRGITGETYMLNQDEELWAKEMPKALEELLFSSHDPLADRRLRNRKNVDQPVSIVRDKTKIISFCVPHSAAVQVYDYKAKKARVLFGPDQVMLAPDEQFTQLSLSGGKPKQPNVIKSLLLFLGPDFSSDIIVVETADHARLSLQLSYNWYFKIDPANATQEEASKLFSVPDFIGDSCKAIASRVRGAVAAVQFDDFHKNSARIIRGSVFGFDENNRVRKEFLFSQNNLVVTNVDIQNVEPVDQRTRDSLQKSVQLAIEITTNSQEAAARHEAERLEQEARGRLERQKIKDEAASETARRELLELQALSEAVASTGQAKAEAQSRAEATRIESEAAVEQARLKAAAASIEAESGLTCLTKAREAELKYTKEQNEHEITQREAEADIEVSRYQRMVTAIGADTLRAIACAGPEVEVKLLQALNLQSTLITDGNAPINLFNTAQGLLGKSLP